MEDDPQFFDLVGSVRAMRRLLPDPVPDELLFKVLNAGVQAPSGMNTQLMEHFEIPVEYGVVVTIPIGYPMGRFGPVSRRPAELVTYFDRWGNTTR